MSLYYAEYPEEAGTVADLNEKIDQPESCRIVPADHGEEAVLPKLGALDRLDKISVGVLFVLLLTASLIVFFQSEDSGLTTRGVRSGRNNVVVINPELDKKLVLAANLLKSGDPARASELLNSLITDFPYDGGPHMLKGDLFLRQQKPIEAMLEYRLAVDLNPDFLDKKMTDVFQGKKIKNTLEEARLAIDAGLVRNPDDAKLKDHREVLYYMLRKVAGSCG